MGTVIENIDSLFSVKSDIKRAIEEKGVDMTNTPFTSYAVKIGEISGGGGNTDVEDGIIMKTISGTYSNSRITSVASNTFLDCKLLRAIDFPNVTTIGSSAFYRCTVLSSISLPKVETLHSGVFFSCAQLRALDLPAVKTISKGCFQSCYNVSTVSIPNCTTIGESAFMWDSRMTSFYGPKVTMVSSGAFMSCYSLSYVSLPVVTTIGSYAFSRCSSLTTLYFDKVTAIPTVYSSTFYGVPTTLTSIYVPASLISRFKTASYWSSMSAKFVYMDTDPFVISISGHTVKLDHFPSSTGLTIDVTDGTENMRITVYDDHSVDVTDNTPTSISIIMAGINNAYLTSVTGFKGKYKFSSIVDGTPLTDTQVNNLFAYSTGFKVFYDDVYTVTDVSRIQ